jgi:ferric-dicitrate binding protein FerR (iron transport regulator)
MNEKHLNIDFEALAASYLSGNISPEEIMVLERLIKEDKQKRQLFFELKRSWMLAGTVGKPIPNKEKAREKIQAKIHQKTIEKEPKIIKWPAIIFRIAAGIILLAIGAWSLYYLQSTRTQQLTAENRPVKVELKDGSVVHVNTRSHISYPARFKNDERRVVLDGEAFFDVARNPEKPFVVETEDFVVTVLGTSFNIRALKNEDIAEVSVITGTVQITTHGDENLILSAGQKAIYNKPQNTLTDYVSSNSNSISWVTQKLIFNQTPLHEVFKTVGNTYNVSFELQNPELAGCLLTATFDQRSIEDVLTIIKETFNLRYIRSGEKIKVAGDGCQ